METITEKRQREARQWLQRNAVQDRRKRVQECVRAWARHDAGAAAPSG